MIIAHRLSTIKNADKIVVMKEGEIAEVGTHNELLKDEDGVYSKLISRQLENQSTMSAANSDDEM